MARLAAAHLGLDLIQDDGELAVTGVTGTNGKTTVAYMLRSILRAAGRPAAMLGTIEYDLVKRRMPADLTTPGPIALTRYLTEAHAAGGRYRLSFTALNYVYTYNHYIHTCKYTQSS